MVLLAGMGVAPSVAGGDPISPAALCAPSVPPSPPGEAVSGGFHSITPTRVLDSRLTIGTVRAGCTAVVDVAGLVPVQATGAALDVVAVGSAGVGYVTVYPCDAPRPLASNLNTRPGDAVPNAVIVPVLAAQRVCLYTSIDTQLVVDVTGWFGPGGVGFDDTTPTRVLDSRSGPRPDGGTGHVLAGTTIRLGLAGLGAIPADAGAVSVNLTVTNTTAGGWITAFPCGTSPPVTSNGNYRALDTRASQAIVGLGGGALCVYTSATIDLIVDIAGWFSPGTDGNRLIPIVGTRVLDSRNGVGGWTGAIPAGQTRSFDPSVLGTVAVGEVAALDVVATGAATGGYVTVFPCGGPTPATSTVNFVPGVAVANLATTPVGADGLICVYSSATTHLVVDVTGSFGPAGALRHLDVTGGINPAFSPDGHDYGVRCQPGANTVTIDAEAVPGATVAIPAANPAGVVTAAENDLITITATTAAGHEEDYFLRCLPHDFPDLAVRRPDDPTPGWYLLTTGVGAAAGSPAYAVILDDHGAPLWYHKTDTPVLDFQRLPNGNLAWVPLLGNGFGTDPTGAYQELTLGATPVRTWSTVATPTDHHELLPLANGNTMLASYHFRPDVDVSALGPGYPATANVMDNWLQEIRPDGTVAWSWHSEDHIAVAETTVHLENINITSQTPDGSALDLIHTNSIAEDPATGDLIVSARHLDAVFTIRRNPGQPDDGNILWKLGGAPPTDTNTTDLTITADPYNGPHAQHDARLLPNGHITMFDDETGHPGRAARAVDYSINPAAGTATMTWQYKYPTGINSGAMGSTRRYPDGHTVIGWGLINQLFSDIGPWDNVTLAVTQRPIGIGYRVVKEPLTSFNSATLRANSE